jgi:hypothetical protein
VLRMLDAAKRQQEHADAPEPVGRPCPTCKAEPGQPCRRPNGDRLLTPYLEPRWHARRGAQR